MSEVPAQVWSFDATEAVASRRRAPRGHARRPAPPPPASETAYLTHRRAARRALGGPQLGEDEKWWEVHDLSKLDISHNEVRALPEDLAVLTALTALRCTHNQLAALPDSIGALPALKQLDASGNRLRLLPPSLGRAAALVQLCLSGNPLEALPDSLTDLTALESLVAEDCALRALPAALGRMRRLSTLCVSRNGLEALPPSLGALERLSVLEVARNQLRELPPLDGCTALTLLDARENALTRVPKLPRSAALAQVFLGHNRLRGEVLGDDALADCPGIAVLDLSNNGITALHGGMAAALPACHTLDVSNNDLTALPAAMGHMRALTRVALEGNPLRSIRRSVLTAGTEALKKYLRSRDAGDGGGGDASNGGGSGGGAGAAGGVDVDVVAREAAADGVILLGSLGLDALPELLFLEEGVKQRGTVLRASRNALTALPATLAAVRGLTQVEVAHNAFTELPAVLAQLPVASLDAAHNRLTAPGFDAGLAAAAPDALRAGLGGSLTALDLSNNALQHVPRALAALPALRSLSMAYNRIASDEAGCAPLQALTALTQLDASNNRLPQLPVLPWVRAPSGQPPTPSFALTRAPPSRVRSTCPR